MKLVILNVIYATGYFTIQYFGGWMIFIYGLQLALIFVYGLFITGVTIKLMNREINWKELIAVPFLALILLSVISPYDDLIIGISLINLGVFLLSVRVANRFNRKFNTSLDTHH